MELAPAEDEPRLLEEDVELPGQRFPGDVVRRAALSVLRFDNYNSFVCLYRGQVAGRIGLLQVGSIGRVKSIFVGSEFRRLGVATSMLSLFVTEAQQLDCTVVCSEVDIANGPSLNLHNRAGFEPVGKILTFRS